MPAARKASGVSAIVLAAGRSTRMGELKLLVPLQGRPLLQHALDSVNRSAASEVVVVLGQDAARVQRALALGRARPVVNPDFREGMSTSIRQGIRAAAPSSGAYLMVLGDQPFVATETLDRLIHARRPGRADIVIPRFEGRRGNPVLVDRSWSAAIDSLTGDQGFRALFRQHGNAILDLDVEDPGVLFDVDTVAQLEAITTRLDQGLPLPEALRRIVAKAGSAEP